MSCRDYCMRTMESTLIDAEIAARKLGQRRWLRKLGVRIVHYIIPTRLHAIPCCQTRLIRLLNESCNCSVPRGLFLHESNSLGIDCFNTIFLLDIKRKR